MLTHPSAARVHDRLRRLLPAVRRGSATAAAAGLLILVGANPVFGQRPGGRETVPANLSAEAPLLDLVAEIGRRSRTFQRQCVLIDRTRGLIVRLREAGPRGDRPYVARTVIRRHEFGAITASIELYAPQDPAEIVAHEFEHLIEQIEGVNLRLMSLVAWSGVRVTTDGSYETERAVMAGRQVAREYGSTRPAGVTPIETTY